MSWVKMDIVVDGAEVPLYAIRCGECGVIDYQDVISIPGVVG